MSFGASELLTWSQEGHAAWLVNPFSRLLWAFVTIMILLLIMSFMQTNFTDIYSVPGSSGRNIRKFHRACRIVAKCKKVLFEQC